MERLRKERVVEASTRVEPPTDQEVLRLVSGIGLRTLQLLEEGGYRSIAEVIKEDADRLSIRSGLANKKARRVQASANEFLRDEAPQIDAARLKIPQPEKSETV